MPALCSSHPPPPPPRTQRSLFPAPALKWTRRVENVASTEKTKQKKGMDGWMIHCLLCLGRDGAAASLPPSFSILPSNSLPPHINLTSYSQVSPLSAGLIPRKMPRIAASSTELKHFKRLSSGTHTHTHCRPEPPPVRYYYFIFIVLFPAFLPPKRTPPFAWES